jgi:hypothetical protein
MKYKVTIADNFHYQDESEWLDGGEYDTYEAALAKAHAIVDESLRAHWEPGMTPDDLMARHCTFGDDPFIVPSVPPRFSARDYARSRVEAICREREGWLPASEMP